MLLAKQQSLSDILSKLGHVAEGVYTVREVYQLAQKFDFAMPICDAVYRILYEQMSATDMVAELLSRAPNFEFNND
jgi:glycerol-3-phosphate dehydrogenase (NAD(P)+)